MFKRIKVFLKGVFALRIGNAAQVNVPTREAAPAVFVRVFANDDGAKVLAFLNQQVNARVSGPEASEGVLRYQDGQRGLLQFINGLIEQGK